MATIRAQNNQRNAANTGWDVIHHETEASIVLYSDGTNVESNYIRQPGYGTTTGTANTYVLALSPAPTALVDGLAVCAKINTLNTGASTININGLGAKSILDSKGNAMTAGKLKANTPYTMRYNGTNFILQGEGASGNAIASDLRLGKTASTDAGDIVGTNTDKKWASGAGILSASTNAIVTGLDFQPSTIIVVCTKSATEIYQRTYSSINSYLNTGMHKYVTGTYGSESKNSFSITSTGFTAAIGNGGAYWTDLPFNWIAFE